MKEIKKSSVWEKEENQKEMEETKRNPTRKRPLQLKRRKCKGPFPGKSAKAHCLSQKQT